MSVTLRPESVVGYSKAFGKRGVTLKFDVVAETIVRASIAPLTKLDGITIQTTTGVVPTFGGESAPVMMLTFAAPFTGRLYVEASGI